MIMRTPDSEGFMECDVCASKPGTPLLCPACINNREVIHRLAGKHAKKRALRRKIDNLIKAGDALGMEVKVMAATLFGKEHTWREGKAPWWQSLVAKVDAWEQERGE